VLANIPHLPVPSAIGNHWKVAWSLDQGTPTSQERKQQMLLPELYISPPRVIRLRPCATFGCANLPISLSSANHHYGFPEFG